jgi:hypothetical protein
MEIVLTAEEIDAATHSEDEYQLAMYALCRAQVKKLIEWLEGDCTEHEPSIFAFTLPVERKDCPECWAALKAAGEGE